MIIRNKNIFFSTPELRLKKLYDCAIDTNNLNMQKILGFVTTDSIENKSLLKENLFQIRKIVSDIRSKTHSIEEMSNQIASCFEVKIPTLKKVASSKKSSFRRAS